MRRIFLIPVILAIVIIIAVSVKIGIAAAGRKTGPIYETPPPQVLQKILQRTPIPTTTQPPTCDFLGNPNLLVGTEISQKYGELRNCFLIDNNWVILTEGLREQNGTRQSGVVAVYRCQPDDTTCLNGSSDHPLAGWQIYLPPCPGELSLGATMLPGKFLIMGTCANYFDIATGTFTNK